MILVIDKTTPSLGSEKDNDTLKNTFQSSKLDDIQITEQTHQIPEAFKFTCEGEAYM